MADRSYMLTSKTIRTTGNGEYVGNAKRVWLAVYPLVHVRVRVHVGQSDG